MGSGAAWGNWEKELNIFFSQEKKNFFSPGKIKNFFTRYNEEKMNYLCYTKVNSIVLRLKESS